MAGTTAGIMETHLHRRCAPPLESTTRQAGRGWEMSTGVAGALRSACRDGKQVDPRRLRRGGSSDSWSLDGSCEVRPWARYMGRLLHPSETGPLLEKRSQEGRRQLEEHRALEGCRALHLSNRVQPVRKRPTSRPSTPALAGLDALHDRGRRLQPTNSRIKLATNVIAFSGERDPFAELTSGVEIDHPGNLTHA